MINQEKYLLPFLWAVLQSHICIALVKSCELEKIIHSSVLSPPYHKFSQDFYAQMPSF